MPKKILVVDYEEKAFEEMRELFQDQDFSLLFARDGQRAAEIFKAEIPDLILTSALLPKVNGFELSKMISSGQLGLIRPVIMYSNIYKAEKYRREATVVSGAVEFFEKPLNKEQLVALAGKLVQGGSGKTESSFPSMENSQLHPHEMPVQTQNQIISIQSSQPVTILVEDDQSQAEILDMDFMEQEDLPFSELAKTPDQTKSEEILEFAFESSLLGMKDGKTEVETILVEESPIPSGDAELEESMTSPATLLEIASEREDQVEFVPPDAEAAAPSAEIATPLIAVQALAGRKQPELFALSMSVNNQSNMFRTIFITILLLAALLAVVDHFFPK